MLRKSTVPFVALWGTLLILGLVLVSPVLGAGDEKPVARQEGLAQTAEAPANVNIKPAVVLPPEAVARLSELSGVTIAWNAETGKFEAPSSEQMAEIGKGFLGMAEGPGDLAGDADEVEVKTLANGMKMANLPFRLMSASVVRVDEDGNLVSEHCVDGADVPKALSLETVDEEE